MSGKPLHLHQERGCGSPVASLVLLHGVTRRAADWLPFTPHFEPSLGWLAIDFPGHGGSDPSPGDYRVVDYVDQITPWIGQTDHPQQVLIGHSLGAMVAALVAARSPKRFAGVVLIDPPFATMGSRFRQSTFYRQFEGLVELLSQPSEPAALFERLRELPVRRPGDGQEVPFHEVRDDASLRTYAEYLCKIDPRLLEPIVAGRWLDGYDLEQVAASIECPVLLIRSDLAAGGMLTAEDAALLCDRIADCRHSYFDGVGHQIQHTHPDLLASEINRFVAEVLSTG